MTRRLPQNYSLSRNKTFTVDYPDQESMSLAAGQHPYLPNGGLGCTAVSHGPACSCAATVRAMLEHGQSTPDMAFSSNGGGQHFVAGAGEATSGWFPQCQSLQGYSSYQYGSLGSSDIPSSSSVAFATAPQQAYANPGSHCRSHHHHHQQQQQQQQPHPIVDPQHFRSPLPMSELNVSAQSHNAPALQSPSSGNSSDGTSSPQTPPASVATPLKQEYGPHGASRDDGRHISFPDLESVRTLRCNGEEVKPDINASIERNIFFKESRWTCYRRNYLFVQCSYSLTPCVPGAPIYVDTPDGKKMVQALGVKLSAVMDGENGKDVGLVQQTPKRDRGPQYPVKVERLGPSQAGETPLAYTSAGSSATSPYLPLQTDDPQKTTSMASTGTHTFERIQFKQATANNGRRRAAQQFYYLLVELHADTRKNPDHDENWVKVAHRISEPMVVRGRSPGHYKDSPPSAGAPSGGAGGHFGSAGYGYGNGGSSLAYGLPSSSQGRGSMGGTPGSGSVGGGGGVSSSSGTYFQAPAQLHAHQLPSTPGWTAENAATLKSPTSVESKSEHGGMTEQEAFAFDNDEGYRYYGSAAWPASLPVNARGAGKMDNGGGAEGASFATASSAAWAYTPPCSRFEGMPTSQGYYHDMKATF